MMNSNIDMINLLHTSSWEVSAILFLAAILNMAEFEVAGIVFNVCHVKNIWCKFHACIIKWSISLNLLTKQLHYLCKSLYLEKYSEWFFMFGVILKATQNSFQKGMAFAVAYMWRKLWSYLHSYLNCPRNKDSDQTVRMRRLT